MKLSVTTIILIIIVSLNSNAQINWVKTGGPYGGRIEKLKIESNGNLIALANTIYRSSDKGLNWYSVPTNTFAEMGIRDIFPINDSTFLVTTLMDSLNHNSLYRSDDNMKTWVPVNVSQINIGINNIIAFSTGDLIEKYDLYICAEADIYKSTDDGLSWHQAFHPDLTASPGILNLSKNSQNILYTGTYLGLYKSTDNGLNWTFLTIDTSKDFNNVENLLIDKWDRIFISTPYGIYRSNDNGTTFEHLINGITPSNCQSLNIIKDSNLITNTWNGTFYSTNCGDSWTKLSNNSGTSLIIEDNKLFMGTNNGVLYSEDMLNTITYRNKGISQLTITSILIDKNQSEANTIIYAGDGYGNLHKSTDNGKSWTYLYTTNGAGITDLKFGKNGYVFASSTWGGISRSTDNGLTWESNATGINDPDIRTVVVDKQNNIYHGSFSLIMKSTDNGETWTNCFKQSQSMQVNSMVINSKNVIFAGTGVYGALRSKNNGSTWEQITNGMKVNVLKLVVNDKDELFAIGNDGNIYKSTNDGNNWTLLVTGKNPYSLCALKENKLLAGFGNPQPAAIYLSTDNGVTWNSQNNGMEGNYANAYDFNSAGNIFIGTENGVYYSQSPLVSVEENNFSNDEIKIYPNPAKDYIYIQPSEGSDTQIFDMLGINVFPAGWGIKGGGRIDISNLAPGMYFIKIGNMVEKFVKF